MLDNFLFWIAILGGLSSYLGLSVFLRFRATERKERTEKRIGQAFDFSLIAPQVKQVRGNYFQAAQGRVRHPSRTSALVAAARRLVSRFSYFGGVRCEDGKVR